MATVSGYVRPHSIPEALALLGEPAAVALAGGTLLNARPTDEAVLMVDLQALGLSGIERAGERRVRLGAMTTLQEIVESELAPEALRAAARRSEPSTLRAAATLGGCVAAGESTSECLATLLVHDALASLVGRDGEEDVPLAGLLADRGLLRGRLLVAVTIDVSGTSCAARSGRTRADRPIVAAVARRTESGATRLALCGVAATPVLGVAAPAVLLEDVSMLTPPGDFRGSSAYRKQLAAVLAARALAGLER